uniref:Uncharacterized protein n=1 Tax=Cannabis sativa TaxID=3483 RepID=A0A803P6A9_CANSA
MVLIQTISGLHFNDPTKGDVDPNAKSGHIEDPTKDLQSEDLSLPPRFGLNFISHARVVVVTLASIVLAFGGLAGTAHIGRCIGQK